MRAVQNTQIYACTDASGGRNKNTSPSDTGTLKDYRIDTFDGAVKAINIVSARFRRDARQSLRYHRRHRARRNNNLPAEWHKKKSDNLPSINQSINQSINGSATNGNSAGAIVGKLTA
ncbi:MAG: hypothetical protein ACI9JZ_001777 [Lentimonas sp.]|jgi:hypothetical protein